MEKTPITSWSLEDRPREKLLLKGKEALSDAELIAILIGSGNQTMSAVDLSKSILRTASDNLHELSRWDVPELMQFKGIGEAKAITIVAALEIGRRKLLSDPLQRRQLNSSNSIYQVMHPLIADLNHEEFWILLLNNNLRLMSKHRVSAGGVSATVVDARIILKKALMELATCIILVHNHPSGNLSPSRADLHLTQKLVAAAATMNMKIGDHVIISQRGYYSFADEGMLTPT